MRLIVCGSRDLTKEAAIWAALSALSPRPSVVVHGGARGVDSIADAWAKFHGIARERHDVTREDWKRIGLSAGPRRNRTMAALGADLCVAFFTGASASATRGTADMIRAARAAGIPVREVRV